MKEEEPILNSATFTFTQESNCISSADEYEELVIECDSSLGIDRDEVCFFILKTEKWSVDDEQDLKKLFNRINNVIKK